MSYIHEALKRAQREKDLLTSKKASWSTYGYGRGILKRQWFVSACLIVVSIAFSAYSWLDSLNQLASSDEASIAVHQAPVTSPARPEPARPPKSDSRQAPLKFQIPRARPKPTNKALPSVKERKSAKQEPQQALPRKPRPEKAQTLYSRALALQKEGRLQDAKKFYEAVLKRSPQLVSALNNLGAIYVKEKNYAAARRVLEKAIQIEPGYVDPYYNLACLHALQKDVSRSLAHLKKAVSVDEAARNWARTDKDLQNLRGHPEYEKIIQGAQGS